MSCTCALPRPENVTCMNSWLQMLFSGKRSSQLHPCPSIPCFFCFTKENPQIYQGFSLTAEPTKSLEKTENTKITKEIPCLELTKEILKSKEWKLSCMFLIVRIFWGCICCFSCVLRHAGVDPHVPHLGAQTARCNRDVRCDSNRTSPNR